MKNKFILFLIVLFFVRVIIGSLYNLHTFAVIAHRFSTGDWLINFSAGFVRRGLGGSFILWLSDLLRLRPNFMLMWVQVALFFTYLSVLFILIRKKQINAWFLVLLLSPVTFLFPILDKYASGRKEILLYFLFALYILCINKNLLKSKTVVYVYTVALAIATLFHELMFFYLPYFLFAPYIKAKIDNEQFRPFRLLPVISGSLLVMVPIYLFGLHVNGEVICSNLLIRGLPSEVCQGVLSWKTENLFKTIDIPSYFTRYTICFLLGLLPFVLFVKYSNQKNITTGNFFFLFSLVFLYSCPLFYFSEDWGRWISIHFMLLLFTSTLLLKEKSAETSNEGFYLPRLWKSETPASKLLSNGVFVLLVIAYLTSWTMHHWGNFSVFTLKLYSSDNSLFEATTTIVKHFAKMF